MKRVLVLAMLLAQQNSLFAAERANPFTGTTSSYEQRLRLLEEKKLEAAIANEELAVEKANQERLRLRSGRLPGAVSDFEPRRQIAIPSHPPAAPPRPAPVASKAPRLVGTVSTPSGWVALVEAEGRVTSVREGQSVAGIKVTAIGRETATLNGTPTSLQPVLARVDAPAAVTPGPLPAAMPAEVIDLVPRK